MANLLLSRIIDIHSHILPGIDDGARTLGDGVAIVKWLAKQGITDIVATPHYVDESEYVSPKSRNLELLEELKKSLEAEKVKVNLFLGNEIYLNDKIMSLIEANEISPMADSKYLLVEMSLDEAFPNYEDYFCDLMNNGYKVVLAHPERYAFFYKDYETLKELHDMGVLFQCNMGSIIGKYGSGAKKIIKKLAKDKMIFALGSDIHRCGSKDYLPLTWKKLSRYYNDNELKQILMTNPAKML